MKWFLYLEYRRLYYYFILMQGILYDSEDMNKNILVQSPADW